ncbi:MAG: MFS transporter [Acidisphaera sp.]|nr:MFS transporter [Acidisphaera sp.]MBV9812063.1 MFS transporter [Acetobacteraceae bacterium]
MDARTRQNILRLAIAQALAGGNATVIFATGAIIGATLAPDPALATVPLSVFVVGMALGTLPAGLLARRFGRRAAFFAGTGSGVCTGLLAALALLVGSFPLYTLATFLGGLYAAVVQSFRFAVADGASDADRPRAVSWVMAGGVFAGVLGPQLVTWTMDLAPPYTFVPSYLAQAGVALVAMAVLAGVRLPRPVAAASAGRPLAVIARQPRFITAVICGVVAYLLMNFLMTSAPLAMRMCGLPITASNFAIQWHIVAMYGPSFFTGALIARLGAPRVVASGMVLLACAVAAALSGVTVAHFSLALILLGLGWNFGFVGASSMVLATHRPEERYRVQSFNDFLVFGTIAVGSFFSGQILADHGWATVNLVALPPIALALLVLLAAALARHAPVASRQPP